ncbi:formimidoylglutamase [Pseudomonas berkeleyensis]|uniref:Formimidoylglutamase n=1 Tax=Pseudomonas berkeleyensis TaxID=2726956 RepID=A0A7G5DM72_9PSED|nr:formimidoylglutamase [Pseudomonas berkeleyensis]QMV62847.1 formimidoylglutamase [Pseudomonas berkeleyensis]WSO38301.1 formimidoylglutamase [Pseudomonas berkeleyensis]
MLADRHSMEVWGGRIDPEADSARWHQRIQALAEGGASGLVLLGFACDEGVRRNQGRVGAAGGPLALRKALANLAWHRLAPAYDAGDVCCEDGDLEAAQARLAHNVCALLDAGHLPLVLGGGHEVAFGSWSGLAEHLGGQAQPRIGIVNFDAHFDLRDPAHVHSSGTPFAQIAEQSAARGWPFRYACLGVSRASNTRALFTRAAELNVLVREDHEIRESTLDAIGTELDAFAADCDALYLTIDIDVLPACEAPGVSAPAARGVRLELLEPLLERLKASGKLRLVDFAELNPEYDIDNRTAKAAARLIHLLSL